MDGDVTAVVMLDVYPSREADVETAASLGELTDCDVTVESLLEVYPSRAVDVTTAASPDEEIEEAEDGTVETEILEGDPGTARDDDETTGKLLGVYTREVDEVTDDSVAI
ncbi:hypothetical protein MBLNU459_g7905t1 [Dothideomycetes sp. NU459]